MKTKRGERSEIISKKKAEGEIEGYLSL